MFRLSGRGLENLDEDRERGVLYAQLLPGRVEVVKSCIECPETIREAL